MTNSPALQLNSGFSCFPHWHHICFLLKSLPLGYVQLPEVFPFMVFLACYLSSAHVSLALLSSTLFTCNFLLPGIPYHSTSGNHSSSFSKTSTMSLWFSILKGSHMTTTPPQTVCLMLPHKLHLTKVTNIKHGVTCIARNSCYWCIIPLSVICTKEAIFVVLMQTPVKEERWRQADLASYI